MPEACYTAEAMIGPGSDSQAGESAGAPHSELVEPPAVPAPAAEVEHPPSAAVEAKDPAERAAAWGSAARSLTLGALLGAALVTWAQFSFRGRWVTRFLMHNELDAEQRKTLLWSSAAGLMLGALVTIVCLVVLLRRKHPLDRLERMLWFLSPLLILPALPVVFRYKPWRERHVQLLPCVLAIALVLELTLRQSLRSVPERVVRVRDWLRAKLPVKFRVLTPVVLVVAGAVGYALFMSFHHVRWHMKLQTHSFDLGIVNNLVWGGLEGRFMQTTIVFGDNPEKYLATHAKYGSYLFLPIYALFPRPETMIVIQSTMLGLSAIPLFFFARKRLSDLMALALAFAWLCYYPMHSANFYDVHEVPIAAFFILATVWAVDARRWVWFGLAFTAALLMREDIPIGLAVIGAFLLLSGHRPVAGLLMASISTVWFVFLRFYVMDGAGEWWFPDMYKGLWADGEKGFKSVLKTLFTNPFFVATKIVEGKKVYYLMHLLVPLVFLPARRWYLWFAFIPGLILTLLVTDYEPIFMFSFHYVMHWAPYLFLAAALALSALKNAPDLGPIRARAAACAMAFSSLVLTYNYGAFSQRAGSLRGGYFPIDFKYSEAERERYADLKELIRMIPPDASVVTSENVGPHLSSRRYIYSLRQKTWGADWLLASSKELNLDRTRATFQKAVKSGEYGVVRRIADFVLMKRGHDTSQNELLMAQWGLDR